MILIFASRPFVVLIIIFFVFFFQEKRNEETQRMLRKVLRQLNADKDLESTYHFPHHPNSVRMLWRNLYVKVEVYTYSPLEIQKFRTFSKM